jgi:hypothetical protein
MESRSNDPHPEAREAREALTRPILLPAHQSLTHCIQFFEKLLLKRLLPPVEHGKLLPTHQFGSRPRHSTIEQTHRLIRGINDALDNRQYCSAAFLDISQAFDKVWHTGLLYKLRRSLPLDYFLILNSYLSNRHFVVKVNTELTDLTPVKAGVPQGSVFGLLIPTLHSRSSNFT